MTDPGARFDAEAADFEASLAEHWNRMKYEMALENVLAHLPRGDSLRVLDAGGGTGAVRPARVREPLRHHRAHLPAHGAHRTGGSGRPHRPGLVRRAHVLRLHRRPAQG